MLQFPRGYFFERIFLKNRRPYFYAFHVFILSAYFLQHKNKYPCNPYQY